MSKASLGFVIRVARVRRGIAQVEMAKILRCSQSALSKIEQGTLEPSFLAAVKLSETLDLGLHAMAREMERRDCSETIDLMKAMRSSAGKKRYIRGLRIKHTDVNGIGVQPS
jgi:ribosome-binding protein aMBF1 (putative translation factor)